MSAANTIGALLVFVNLGAAGENSGAFGRDDAISLMVMLTYLAVAVPLAIYRGRRIGRPAYVWISDERRPTADELEASLAQPWRQAVSVFQMWGGAVVVFALLNFSFDRSGRQIVLVGLGILLAGVAASAVAYLLVERALRPVFALALDRMEAPEPVATLGVGPRLMLSWALGAGIPLLSIGLVFIGGVSSTPAVLIAFDVVVGLVLGWLLMRSAASSVAEPLGRVRVALGAVQAGDLDRHLDISDGGEVGFLQAAFNRMVDGLRERRRLQDLFGRHVGEEVARLAVEQGVRLGGELREATALFVDLTGSTGITHAGEPADVVAMLNDFFEAVVRITRSEGGLVNKFAGDGALCIFGAPADQPDHAARALRASRELRDAIKGMGLEAGIGVASGKVVAGNVGAADRYEYTVIGDAVNVASRLTDEAKSRPGRVLAAADTVRLAASVGWRPAGSFDLRGRPEPVPASEPDE